MSSSRESVVGIFLSQRGIARAVLLWRLELNQHKWAASVATSYSALMTPKPAQFVALQSLESMTFDLEETLQSLPTTSVVGLEASTHKHTSLSSGVPILSCESVTTWPAAAQEIADRLNMRRNTVDTPLNVSTSLC